jgi:Glutathione S-transferase, N-terminal domain
LKVFWVSGSPYSWRVLLALQIKGLAFHSCMLGKDEGGLDSPELRAINPSGTVPTLADTDSTGILAEPPLPGHCGDSLVRPGDGPVAAIPARERGLPPNLR